MDGRSFREAHSAGCHPAAILVSPSYSAAAVSLPKPTRQREGAAHETVHCKHISHIKHSPHISTFPTKHSKAPLGAKHTLHHRFYRKGKQRMGVAGAEVGTKIRPSPLHCSHTPGKLCKTHKTNMYLDSTKVQTSRRVICSKAPELSVFSVTLKPWAKCIEEHATPPLSASRWINLHAGPSYQQNFWQNLRFQMACLRGMPVFRSTAPNRAHIPI